MRRVYAGRMARRIIKNIYGLEKRAYRRICPEKSGKTAYLHGVPEGVYIKKLYSSVLHSFQDYSSVWADFFSFDFCPKFSEEVSILSELNNSSAKNIQTARTTA